MGGNRRARLYTARPGQWRALKPVARQIRRESTLGDRILGEALRKGRLGARFRRQRVIGRYIVDFFNVSAGLIVEIDGPVHDRRKKADAAREKALIALGYRVLRFSNEQVFDRIHEVLETIRSRLNPAPGPDSPSPTGRGGQGAR